MYLLLIVIYDSNLSLYRISLTYTLLFYIDFSSSAVEQYDALLTSNIVPMYRAFRGTWQSFDNFSVIMILDLI